MRQHARCRACERCQGVREFVDDALGWNSKFKLVKDYFSNGEEHSEFIEDQFSEHIFSDEQLEEAIEAGGHDRVAEQATSMAAALVGPPAGRAGADAGDGSRAEAAWDAPGGGRS